MNYIRPSRWPSLARLKNQDGFTIIELMVAITVFALLMAAAALGMNGALNLTRNNRQRAVAANLAATQVDKIQAMDFDSINVGYQQITQTVDGVNYIVNINTEWGDPRRSPATATAAPTPTRRTCARRSPCSGTTWAARCRCRPDPDHPARRDVRLEHRQHRRAGPRPQRRAPGQHPGHDQRAIGQRHRVHDGRRLRVLRVPGPGLLHRVPQLRRVRERPGRRQPHADRFGRGRLTVQTQVNYDRAATLSLTMVGGAGGAIPDTMSYTIFNTGLLPTGTKRISGAGLSGPNRTISSLYPTCPATSCGPGPAWTPIRRARAAGGAYYPGGTRDPALPTSPGGTTTGNINMPSLLVNVRKAGVPLAGARCSVVPRSRHGKGARSGQTWTLSGTTDVNGNILGALPYGLWTVQVKVGGVLQTPTSGVWPSVTLNPPYTQPAKSVNVAVN